MCFDKTLSGAAMCLHEGAEEFQQLHFMGVCEDSDNQLKQAIYNNRTTVTEKDMYLPCIHEFATTTRSLVVSSKSQPLYPQPIPNWTGGKLGLRGSLEAVLKFRIIINEICQFNANS